MNKKKQPQGFCLPRPSNNLRDKDGAYKVRFIPIFGTALSKYVGPVTHMDKAVPMAETGCRMVTEMFNDYQNKLCKKGLYADPAVIQIGRFSTSLTTEDKTCLPRQNKRRPSSAPI